MHPKLLTCISALLFACAAHAAEPITIASPDGHVRLSLLTDGPRPRVGVTLDDKPVIEPSPLSFIVDGNDVLAGKPGQVQTYEADQTYATRGVHSRATNRHRGAKIPLGRCDLEVRAFDDGVAYRFILPGNVTEQRTPDETSEFTLPAGATVWSHGLRGHYEGEYEQRDVDAVAAGEWVAPPLVFKLPASAGYAAITEAALINYSGMALESKGERRFVIGLAHRQPVSYPYELRYSKEDIERLSHPAKITGTITTPWRVVMIARDLNALVNSDIISNLNPPPDEKIFPGALSPDWVQPGRAVWRYLDNRGSPDRLAMTPPTATTSTATSRAAPVVPPEETKTFNRVAGELGFEYNVLEGFWSRWSDAELREVALDARRHNVRLFVWVHSKKLRDPAARAELFKRCNDAGVAGLKIDFFDHEHKEVIDLYQAILRETAEHQLLVNFHGANKPTGESRTWPNELTREAVRGMEASKVADRATHDATLPFTRYLAGPADYTPMVFGERRGNTTWSHQIATAVVFTMPLLTYAAHPQAIVDNPARELIKSIPPTWDQTIVLPPSEIGQIAVMARRRGDDWFVGVVNGAQPRSFELTLSFLPPGTNYAAMIARDVSGNSASLDFSEGQTMSSNQALKIGCAAGGGFVARLTPVR